MIHRIFYLFMFMWAYNYIYLKRIVILLSVPNNWSENFDSKMLIICPIKYHFIFYFQQNSYQPINKGRYKVIWCQRSTKENTRSYEVRGCFFIHVFFKRICNLNLLCKLIDSPILNCYQIKWRVLMLELYHETIKTFFLVLVLYF